MKTSFAVVVMLVGSVAGANAQSLPTLEGRWIGASEATVLGNAIHYPGEAGKPRSAAAEVYLTVEGQDGRRFWGKFSSGQKDEPIVGILGYDGNAIRWQSSNGMSDGTLIDANTMDILYSHTNAQGLVASVARFKRAK